MPPHTPPKDMLYDGCAFVAEKGEAAEGSGDGNFKPPGISTGDEALAPSLWLNLDGGSAIVALRVRPRMLGWGPRMRLGSSRCSVWTLEKRVGMGRHAALLPTSFATSHNAQVLPIAASPDPRDRAKLVWMAPLLRLLAALTAQARDWMAPGLVGPGLVRRMEGVKRSLLSRPDFE
jgi:hypothetical protein